MDSATTAVNTAKHPQSKYLYPTVSAGLQLQDKWISTMQHIAPKRNALKRLCGRTVKPLRLVLKYQEPLLERQAEGERNEWSNSKHTWNGRSI